MNMLEPFRATTRTARNYCRSGGLLLAVAVVAGSLSGRAVAGDAHNRPPPAAAHLPTVASPARVQPKFTPFRPALARAPSPPAVTPVSIKPVNVRPVSIKPVSIKPAPAQPSRPAIPPVFHPTAVGPSSHGQYPHLRGAKS